MLYFVYLKPDRIYNDWKVDDKLHENMLKFVTKITVYKKNNEVTIYDTKI